MSFISVVCMYCTIVNFSFKICNKIWEGSVLEVFMVVASHEKFALYGIRKYFILHS